MSDLSVLTTVPQRALAEPLAAILAEHGIRARVTSDDCGGVDPALSFTRGVEVLVPTSDLTRAQEILDEAQEK